jgi:hypothetical protein
VVQSYAVQNARPRDGFASATALAARQWLGGETDQMRSVFRKRWERTLRGDGGCSNAQESAGVHGSVATVPAIATTIKVPATLDAGSAARTKSAGRPEIVAASRQHVGRLSETGAQG